jgi:hypothetical protein
MKKDGLDQTRTTNLSKDSIGNNVGNIGRYIARHIEERETNPNKYKTASKADSVTQVTQFN